MSSVDLESLVQELRAAGEITRLRVLALLSDGELSVGELAHILAQSQPRLSRHLKLLHSAGLIERLPEGAWVFYRLPSRGRTRALVDAMIGTVDKDDPMVRRDQERLNEVKAQRAQAADQYFSRVAEQWDELRALHYSERDIEQAVLEATGEGPYELILDLGTGTGRMLELLAPRSARVEGIDLSHHMLTVARSNLEAGDTKNASVRQGDVSAVPYGDACADLVIIHQVLHYLDDPSRALGEAARVLKPNGRLIVIDFAPHQLEHLREDHAHRRLGVSEQDFSRWALVAGFAAPSLRTFEAEGDGVGVNLWVANRVDMKPDSNVTKNKINDGGPINE